MYISKFRIQNFKSFEDVTFHFHKSVNILTGINNSGKTSVLEAIALWHECYGLLIQKSGRTVANKYNMGQFILGTTHATYTPYTDIISVRSPRYADIFNNFDTKKIVFLTVTLTKGAKSLDIGFAIKKQEGLMNYGISLSDFSAFDFQLFNDNSFIENPEKAIKTIFSIPVGTLVSQEEIKRWQAIRRYVVSRNSREVLRNRLRDLRNRFEDNYAKLLGNLQTILVGSPNSANLTLIDDKDVWVEADISLPNQTSINLALMGSGTIQIIELLLSIHEEVNELNIVLLDEPDTHLHRQLQKRLLSAIARERGTQVFLTTHNEALIRDANPEWLFHLEQSPIKEYTCISKNLTTKKGLLQSGKSPIIQALGNGSGLDFINALEADILFIVEGEDDALRIQKILGNDNRKFAFWLLRGVDNIFGQISILKDIFTQIKNHKNLWEKSVLIFDKDFMTERHRLKLIDTFTNKLKIKTHIWESYNFESVLFTDLNNLTNILSQYISQKGRSADKQTLQTELLLAMRQQIEQKIQKIDQSRHSLYDDIYGNFKSRREKLNNMSKDEIIEDDKYLQKALETYWKNACNETDFHKIMNKADFQHIFQTILQPYNLTFTLDDNTFNSDFDELFDMLSVITMPEAYYQIRALIP